MITLPSREETLVFHRQRWEEVHNDRALAATSDRIETNAWGQIVMTPPPGGPHSSRQFQIANLLQTMLNGRALTECPVVTSDGVKAMDAAWYSSERYQEVRGQLAFEIAPEICVEILSPSNTDAEMTFKRRLYFDAGAKECWQCDLEGQMSHYLAAFPDQATTQSQLCPSFPSHIED